MPNWCYNFVEIEGNNKDIKKLKKFVCGNNPFDFNKIIPYPKKFKEIDESHNRYYYLKQKKNLTTEEKKELIVMELEDIGNQNDGYNSGGYNWCVKSWGTKWNSCETKIEEEDDGYLSYRFDTAWNPPFPVIKKLSKLFKNLTITIGSDYEDDDGYIHYIKYKDGKIIERWKEEKEYSCLNCGKEYKLNESTAEYKNAYCSKKCEEEYEKR